MKICKVFWAALLVLGLAAPAWAGWMIEEKMDGETTTIYFQKNQVRDEAADSISILDLAKERITLLNPPKKTYWSGPISEMVKMRDSAMNQMREQLKQLPPEQREAAMQAMPGMKGKKQGPPPKVQVKKTGQSQTVAGFKAEKYEIWVDGQLREEQWITSDIAVVKEVDASKMKKMTAAFAMGDQDDFYELDPTVQDLWKKGYAVKVVTRVGQGENMVREVTKAERKDLPASLFSVPQDYRQVGLEEVMQ